MTRTLDQHRQGMPFPFPQAGHYAYLQFTVNFHGWL
jgi:hypothetical protein